MSFEIYRDYLTYEPLWRVDATACLGDFKLAIESVLNGKD